MPIYSPSQATKGISVQALVPKAVFQNLYIHCKQPDGSVKVFNILVGEVPTAEPGAGNLAFNSMDIYIVSLNIGKLYIKVVDEDAGQIGYWSFVGGALSNTPLVFDMPSHYHIVKVEIGHITDSWHPAEVIDDTRTFTITPLYLTVPTDITIVAPDTVNVGAGFGVSGVLRRSDNSMGIAGQTVNVYYNGTLLQSVTTDLTGAYSAPNCAIPTAGSYTLKAAFLGTSTYAASAADMGITVEGAATYIVYDSDLTDQRSAELIAEKKGFTLLQTPETKDPSVYDTLYDDNNIVCVAGGLANLVTGLPYANAYSYYYFPMRRGSGGMLYGQFGISADGRRIIAIKRRVNGTTVTIVAGLDEADTWRAANEYVAPKLSPLVPVGVVVIALGGAVYATRR